MRGALIIVVVACVACNSRTVEQSGGGDGGALDAAGAADGGSALGECGAATATYTATGTDQSAVVADGTSKSLTSAAITSDSVTSNADNSSFYGQNAAVLAKNGGTITMECDSVTTTGSGANGVFATGTGSSITLTNVKISCQGDGGHGVDATQAASLTLRDVDITTAGAHGAAIATDRGGGTIDVTGGKVTTSGTDSPGIYSTGDISVTGAAIAATGAEAAVIEGANSITVTDSALSAAKGTRDRGLMIYQSMSGDAQGTHGVFTMTGGSFTWPSTTGPAFYVTNSTGVITLTGVTITCASATLFKAGADQWGASGSNGGNIDLTADGQALEGDVVLDDVSTMTATLKNGSTLAGAINAAATAKSVALALDATSTWTVTADSVVTTLTDASATFAHVVGGGHTVCYQASANGATTGTYSLSGGGTLKPCN